MNKKFALFTFFILVLAFTACNPATIDPYNPGGTYTPVDIDLSNPDDIKPFTSEASYQEFFSSSYNYDDIYYGGRLIGVTSMADSVSFESSSSVKVAPVTGGSDGYSLDFSGTNNQVSGVDEADLLKSDGNYIYTITDNTVFIIDAYPGKDSKVISQFNLENVSPSDLILDGDKLVVVGNIYSYQLRESFDVLPSNGMSFAYIYDISDKENPSLEKEFLIEGNYDTARLNDEVYIVTRVRPEIRDVYPLPMFIDDGVVSTLRATDIFYIPNHYNYPELAMISKIDLDSYSLDSTAVTVDYLQTVYMANDNAYLVGQESLSVYSLKQDFLEDLITPMLSSNDSDLIRKIKETDNDVLSHYEKESKISNVKMKYFYSLSSKEQDDIYDDVDSLVSKKIDEVKYLNNVIIHKIDLSSLKVTANAKVPGQVVNQFSLDEFDGNLRIVTTIPQDWSNMVPMQKESSNNIYVLDDSLNLVGSLTGLAENERIYSTRFVGDRLYMVTFRQVDPFFVIDLSNPKKPESLGELKIPGFSRYLHPYDENHIIGIGQDATDLGRTTGLKISLFDVTDVSNPVEVSKYVTEERYASSTALYEHKAFLFSKEKNLLVIPAYSYEWDNGKQSGYSGAFVFDIDESQIALRGLIDHTKGSNDVWSSQVERSLYIEDLLYTKSRNLLRINSLDDLSSVNNVSLNINSIGDIPIY